MHMYHINKNTKKNYREKKKTKRVNTEFGIETVVRVLWIPKWRAGIRPPSRRWLKSRCWRPRLGRGTARHGRRGWRRSTKLSSLTRRWISPRTTIGSGSPPPIPKALAGPENAGTSTTSSSMSSISSSIYLLLTRPPRRNLSCPKLMGRLRRCDFGFQIYGNWCVYSGWHHVFDW